MLSDTLQFKFMNLEQGQKKQIGNAIFGLFKAPEKQVTEEESMSPEEAIRHISMIFADAPQGNTVNFSPQGKIILLTLMICATVFVMYTIFESFIDTIILAFLSGMAYVKLRQRFIRFCKRSHAQPHIQRSFFQIVTESIFYALLIILIPWINYSFTDQQIYESWSDLYHAKINNETISQIGDYFFKSNNIIKLVQIYLFVQIVLNFFGKILQRIFYYIKSMIGQALLKPVSKQTKYDAKDRLKTFLHTLFAILFVIGLCFLIICLAGIFFQLSGMINSAGRAIQKYNNCTLYSDDHSEGVVHCTDVITGTLKPYLPNIRNTSQIGKCIESISKAEKNYLNFTFLQHKKQICLVYQMLKEYSPQAIDQFFNIEATKAYLTSIFKNLLKLLSMTSDAIFSLTTFISIFMITTKSVSSSQHQLHIFGEAQTKLVSQITDLISDYTMVTTKHIVLSLFIFQIFQFSQINIIFSLLIGAVTLFPFISVMMIVTLLCGLKYWFTYQRNHLSQLSAVICLVLFNIGSNRIFQNHFNKIDFNKALVSLSAVFGLYRFGVAGIFYGPLVILLFICAYDALSKSKL